MNATSAACIRVIGSVVQMRALFPSFSRSLVQNKRTIALICIIVFISSPACRMPIMRDYCVRPGPLRGIDESEQNRLRNGYPAVQVTIMTSCCSIPCVETSQLVYIPGQDFSRHHFRLRRQFHVGGISTERKILVASAAYSLSDLRV